MARKKPLKRADVEKALIDNGGVINRAAIQLKRHRETVSVFINSEKHKKHFAPIIENLTYINRDESKATLRDMAFGNYHIEKVTQGGVIVEYNPGPHFPALKLMLEMSGDYTPKQENINVDAGKLVAKLTDMGGFAPISDTDATT